MEVDKDLEDIPVPVLYLTLSKGTSAQQASKEDKRAQRTCIKHIKFTLVSSVVEQ
jgi:hypothetical protein